LTHWFNNFEEKKLRKTKSAPNNTTKLCNLLRRALEGSSSRWLAWAKSRRVPTFKCFTCHDIRYQIGR